MRLSREELKGLMKNKLIQAGLREDHADQTAEILTWAHERGFASHGAVRVEYYCERIFKGGITHEPNITWNQTALLRNHGWRQWYRLLGSNKSY